MRRIVLMAVTLCLLALPVSLKNALAAPETLSGMAGAEWLTDPLSCRAELQEETLRLRFSQGLPEGAALTVRAASGRDLALRSAEAGMWEAQTQAEGWFQITVQAPLNGGAVALRYVYTPGEDAWLREAALTAPGGTLTRQADGGYRWEESVPDVERALISYDENGVLTGSLLTGDRRAGFPLPMTVAYDVFGGLLSATASDARRVYRWDAALAVWTAGEAVADLPAFTLAEHPAPAAAALTVPPVYREETAAGIDREAVLLAAPARPELWAEDGALYLSVGAFDAAAVTVDGTLVFSSERGSLTLQDGIWTASSLLIRADSALAVTLFCGACSAAYEKDALLWVSDGQGVTWYQDGTLCLTQGAATAWYSRRGKLTRVFVEQMDGATAEYNASGRLVGLVSGAYSWSRDDGWRGTAINENGNEIHPKVKAPAGIDLSGYPGLEVR